jgi:hypothetical protein
LETVFRRIGLKIGDHKVVCPCAGEGVLTRGFIPNALLFDKHPKPELGVKQSCYLRLDLGALGDPILIIENPPFGRQHVVRFFNRMASFRQVKIMAIIMPDRFRADQLDWLGRDELDPRFHCIDHLPLPYGSFEDAGGSIAQIQTSFQIWVRKAAPRAAYEGVRVGEHNIPPAGGVDWWVKKFNPRTYTKSSDVITKNRPKPDKYNAMPVQFPPGIAGAEGEQILRAAIDKMWAEYPEHPKPSLHPGNLKLHLDEILKTRRTG